MMVGSSIGTRQAARTRSKWDRAKAIESRLARHRHLEPRPQRLQEEEEEIRRDCRRCRRGGCHFGSALIVPVSRLGCSTYA